MTTTLPVLYRPMRREDIPFLVAIESRADASSWSERMFARELELAHSRSCVACQAGRPVGFGIAWVVGEEADILELAVLPECRGRGIGRAVAEEVLRQARAAGARRARLELRKGNEAAARLYSGLGFKAVGERKGFYSRRDGPADAILMECRL